MASPATTTRTKDLQASAWQIVLGFFVIFCALVATGGYFGWRYYSSATVSVMDTVALKYVDTGILRQQAGSNVLQDLVRPPEVPAKCQQPQFKSAVCDFFTEGQRLVGRRGAGFGPVASLALPDGTQVNLHTQPDGFDFSLEKYQVSRWTTDRQEVEFEQNAGYARFDLGRDQPYKNVTYAVKIGGITVYLAPGGSYSTDVPRDENGNPRGRLITDAPLLAEIAVRRGTARVQAKGQTLDLHDGDLIQIALDGTPTMNAGTPYQDAAWELIPDGDFSRFTTEQYNSQGQTTTWNINDYNDDPQKKRLPGRFSVTRTCPPEKLFCVAGEYISYGQFQRDVGDGKPYETGVLNPLDVDISEYTQSLVFHAQVSVLNQTLSNTGDNGTECPVTIQINYKIGSPNENDQKYLACVFYLDQKNPDYVQSQGGSIEYHVIKQAGFYPIEFDLRKVGNPNDPNAPRYARYISGIRVYANGHDYFSQVTRVSLVGK